MHPGDTLAGRYLLIREIGRGGMGAVFEARDLTLERDVAVKTISAHSTSASERARLAREARIVARMDHPSVVPLYDLLDLPAGICLIMPLLRGVTLREMLQGGPLTAPFAATMALQVARALQYSHEQAVVHRDIKPENIMILGDSQGTLNVKIMDFGVALTDTDTDEWQPGGVVGTVDYLSPEQVRSVPIDYRTDIYSLGVVLYESLTGRSPFTGAMMDVMHRILTEEPPRLRETGQHIPEVLDKLVARCLYKEPGDRPSLRSVIKRLGKVPMATVVTRPRGGGSATPTTERPPAKENIANEATMFINPLAGRRDELFSLSSSLNKARRGQLHMCLIAGGSGTGKSRMLLEVARLAHSRGVPMYWSRCAQDDNVLPYYGLCSIIRDYCGRAERAGQGIVPLADLASELIATFPMLADIPALQNATRNLASQPAAGGRQDPSGAPQKLSSLELLARAFMVMGQGRPMILALDDLHRTALSADALAYLFRRLASTPTLLLASYRPRPAGRIDALRATIGASGAGDRFRYLELSPLGAEHHTELSQLLLDGGRLAPATAQRLYAATEGNPLACQELIQALRTADCLRTRDGQWVIEGEPFATAPLPDSTRAIIELRVGQLGAEVRDFLSSLAVLGQTFDERDLAIMCDRRSRDELLPAALQSGFLSSGDSREAESATFAGWAFTNHLVRDVLVADLPVSTRRRLFQRYANGLIARAKDIGPQNAYRLARGFASAHLWDQALHYGIMSARGALRCEGFEQARVILLASLPDRGDASNDERPSVPLECEARLLLVETCLGLGDMVAVRGQAERARECFSLLGDTVGQVRSLAALAGAEWHERRLRAALGAVEAALELIAAMTVDERDELAGEVSGLVRVGRRAGAAIADHSILDRIAEVLGEDYDHRPGPVSEPMAGDPGTESQESGGESESGLRVEHSQLLVLGAYQAARVELARAEDKSADEMQPTTVLFVRKQVARLAVQLGRYDEAVAQCRAALAQIGEDEPFAEAQILSMQARAYIGLGSFEEANHNVRDGFACVALNPGDDRDARGRVLVELFSCQGNILLGRGRFREALSAFKRGLSLCNEGTGEQSIALFNAGHACVLAGRYELAIHYLARAKTTKQSLEEHWGLAHTYASWTVILLDRGEMDRARKYAQEGLRLGRQCGDPKLMAWLRYIGGQVALALGELQRAEHQFQLGLRDANDCGARPEATRLHLALARVHASLGHPELADTHAEQGRASAYGAGSPADRGDAQLVLARLRMARGDLAASAEHIESARSLIESIGNPYRTLDIELARAELDIERARYDAALHELDELYDRAMSLGARTHAARTWRVRAHLHRQQGATEAADKAAQRAERDFQALALSVHKGV